MKYFQTVTIIFSCILFIQAQSNWQTDIIEGDCENVTETDMVTNSIVSEFNDNVKEHWFMWAQANYNITCVNVSNLIPSFGSLVEILDGGVGQNSISLHMLAQPGRGMDFNITIYADYETEVDY